MHIFLEKETTLFDPNLVFAPMPHLYCNKLDWGEESLSPHFTDLSPHPDPEQPRACSGEINRVLMKANLK